jgi:hypothetical protein
VQELSQALATSEAQKASLLCEVQLIHRAEENALYYADLAKSELRAVRHELVATKDGFEKLRCKFKQQQSETLSLKTETDDKLGALLEEARVSQAEKDEALQRMQGGAYIRHGLSSRNVFIETCDQRGMRACRTQRSSRMHTNSCVAQLQLYGWTECMYMRVLRMLNACFAQLT